MKRIFAAKKRKRRKKRIDFLCLLCLFAAIDFDFLCVFVSSWQILVPACPGQDLEFGIYALHSVRRAAGNLLPRLVVHFFHVVFDLKDLAARRAAQRYHASADLERNFLPAHFALHIKNLDSRSTMHDAG